jgi:hypothetical protein
VRWGEGRADRYAEIAAEFVRLNVDVILAGGTEPAIAAKQATSIIPIVFPTAGDPVASKLVTSLARPGGNVTGLSNFASDLAAKRLEASPGGMHRTQSAQNFNELERKGITRINLARIISKAAERRRRTSRAPNGQIGALP